jgi:hypothetical protein
MLAKIRRSQETELNPEHWAEVSTIEPPLAVQEIQEHVVLSAAAGTVSEISACPRTRAAPGEVGSVAGRAGVGREPANNVAPPAWVHAAAAAVEAVAVAEGGKQP